MSNQLQLFELLALGIYLVLLLGIGIRSSRQVKTSTDYTLAGREVPWMILLATSAATMVGGGMSIGIVSTVYEVGLAIVLASTGAYFSLIITGIFLAPRLRGLNLITAGNYFELKFGEFSRILATLNSCLFLFTAIVAQMVAMGTITNSVFGVDYRVAVVIGAMVTVFYSTVGGIKAVLTTDVLQFIVLVGGLGAAAAILMVQHGGLNPLLQQVDQGHLMVTSHWSLMRVVTLFCAFLLGETLTPPYVVRCLISKDVRGARLGVAGAGAFLLLFLPLTSFVLGISALADPTVQQAVSQGNVQLAFPTILRTAFHPIFAGVMIAALIAAVMSSADSCLSSLATVAMEDIYRHAKPKATDRQLLLIARWTTLLLGSLAAVFAFFFKNIISIIEFMYDFWGPSMVLPFLVGTLWYKRTWIYASVASMVAGTTATIVWRFVLDIPGDVSPALLGFTVAGAALLITYPLTRNLPLGRWVRPRDPRISGDLNRDKEVASDPVG